jgi:hypothetical protein
MGMAGKVYDGLKPSPYKCIKALLIAIEIIRGDRRDHKNPFHWGMITYNLPGDPEYDPSKPRLSRLRTNFLMASLILCYVDDMRAAAAGEDLCWEVMHTVSSKVTYLGIQIATRKTRPPSPRPGPWAGSVVTAQDKGIGVKVSQDKRDKIKVILQHTLDLFNGQAPIPLKLLESCRGSLVYVQCTYPTITPYFKGYHLTIDSWHPDRDQEGWRLPKSQPLVGYYPPAPTHVHPVPRFLEDVESLILLFSSNKPPTRFVCSESIKTAVYGYVDASGGGFGYTMGAVTGLFYSHGTWTDAGRSRSSNF